MEYLFGKLKRSHLSVSPAKEKILVELAVRGDKEAFTLLMVKYQHRITNVVRRYVTNHSEILDISQESFLKAYKGIADFRGDSSFYTWLYRIAINTAKNSITMKKMRFIDLDVETLSLKKNDPLLQASHLSEPEDNLIKEEVDSVINEAVQFLPEKLRIPFILFENEGRSYTEIAHLMHCPIGTVRSRLYRARKRLESDH